MEDALAYDFSAIDTTVRGDIQATATRFNGLLEDLKRQLMPLQAVWSRESAQAYREQQLMWHQAALALNDILIRLGTAVGGGSDDVAVADSDAAKIWFR